MGVSKGPYGQMQEFIDAAIANLNEAKAATPQQQQAGKSPPPHLGKMQAAFGKHDVSGVTAHSGGSAASAGKATSAAAYATGNQVAFKGPPSLHTAAHEAAHVVQQGAKKYSTTPSVEAKAQALAHEIAHSKRAPHEGRVVVSPPSKTATVAQALTAAQGAVKNLANLEKAGSAVPGAAAAKSAGHSQ